MAQRSSSFATFPSRSPARATRTGQTLVIRGATSALVRRRGRVCEAGWLGGLAPIASFNPILQMPSGVHYSLFGSFVFGSPQFPLSEIPLQDIVERVAAGIYKAQPATVFPFSEIQQAHRLMESGRANGKVVVSLAR